MLAAEGTLMYFGTRLMMSASDVTSVDVHVAQGHLSVCNIPDPASALESKFSLRHAAALALSGADTAAISTFSDDVAGDPALAALRQRVTVHGDMPPGGAVRVVVHRASGTPVERAHNTGVAERDLDRQGQRLEAKFRSLATPVIGDSATQAVEQAVLSFEALPSLSGLMDAARARGDASNG